MYKDYNWEFDEEVARNFDIHVRKSVQMYEEFHELISKMSKFFIEDDTNVLDIGTSTGELLKKLVCPNRNCKYIGIDNKVAMVNKAIEKLGDEFFIENIDIKDYKISNCSVITMVLVLQFLKISDRQDVINKIYSALNKGGAFFFVDKIRTENVIINDIYNDLYYDFKLRKGLNSHEILQKNRSLRGIQKTMSLDENLNIIKKAGFNTIDIFMKYNNFIGILAIK
ncbi:methyltransferase (plasmid) [Clostridium perfringens]|nr:methyltransferase domain-containing protein [Clostridium sp.]MDU7550025.1 methyltransferase domain-containing protein [Clostridium perfringens]